MNNRLFVGGLAWVAADHDLRDAFAQFGTVTDAKVVLDRETGRSRGFGFVTFETEEQATAAVQGLDGQQLGGRNVTVKVAEERRPRAPGGFGAPASPSGGYTEERRGRRATMEGAPPGQDRRPEPPRDRPAGGGYGDRPQSQRPQGGGYGDRPQGGGYGDRPQGGGYGGGGGGGYRGGGGGGGGGYGGGGGGGFRGGGGGFSGLPAPPEEGADEGKPGRNYRDKKRKGKKRHDNEEW